MMKIMVMRMVMMIVMMMVIDSYNDAGEIDNINNNNSNKIIISDNYNK